MEIEQAQQLYKLAVEQQQVINAQDCLQAGDTLYQHKQHLDAIALYEIAIAQTPQWASAYFRLGEALLEVPDIEAAIAAYQTAIQLSPEAFIHYVGLGRALSQQQQWDDAISAYQTAIQLNPSFPWAYHHLAQLFKQQQRYTEAIAAYRQELHLNPQFYWSYLHLGDLLLKTNQPQTAIAIFQQAIDLNPHQPEAHQRLKEAQLSQQQQGDYLLQQHQWCAAIAAYQEAIQLNPDHSWYHYGLGYAQLKQKQWETAILSFKQAIELNPDCGWSYCHLGYCYFQLSQYKSAIAAYHQAIEINPDIPASYTYLADILVRQNQYHPAITAYLRAIDLQPDWLTPYIKLRHLETFHSVYHTPEQYTEIADHYHQIIQTHPQQIEAYINLGNLLTKQGLKTEAINIYQQGIHQNVLKFRPELLQYPQQQKTTKGPQFLMIGVMKGGTTSLYEYLVKHPQIVPSLQKEIDFFNYQYNLGLDWYISHFPSLPQNGKFLTGEASPTYLLDLKTMERVYQHFPNIKLLIILRNPIDRAISQYYDNFNWLGREKRSLQEAIDSEIEYLNQLNHPTDITINSPFWKTQKGHVWRGMYIYFIEKWMQVFPSEQFLIMQSEDLYINPEKTMQEVFNFLEIEPLKLQQYRKYTAGSYTQTSPKIREKLSAFYQPHNQKLEELLNRKFDWN
ncbi:MAG: tetratricopeptide repeat protein [Microcoleaceae cyanobacterium]